MKASLLLPALGESSGLEPALLEAAGFQALVKSRRKLLDLDERGYVRHLAATLSERDLLKAAVAPPETWLFRYPRSYHFLRELMGSRGGSAPWRLASLGCAYGAEPFSMAMTARACERECEIVAVDSNGAALEVARQRILPATSGRGDCPEWASRWWRAGKEGVTVSDEVRELVTFVSATVLDPALPDQLGLFDVVFCRNVAIYLSAAARLELGRQISRLLKPGGTLFLGHAEPISTLGLQWRAESPETFAWSHEPAKRRRAAPAGKAPRSEAVASRPASSRAPAPRRSASTGRASEARVATIGAEAAAPFAGSAGAGAGDQIESAKRLADAGEAEKAHKAATLLYRAGSREPELLHLLGTLELARGDGEQAESYLRALVYLEPSHSEALLKLALLAEGRGDGVAARRLRRRAGGATR